MRKILFSLLATFTVCSVTACGGGSTAESDVSSPKEDAAEAETYDYYWPENDIAKLIPKPESDEVEIVYESSDTIVFSAGQYSKDAYSEYVNECISNGFNVEYERYDNNYTGMNEAGDYIYTYYYSEEDESEYDSPTLYVEAYTAKSTEEEDGDETDSVDETDTNDVENTDTGNSSGISDDFKAAMDSYEEIMNDYCDFMIEYAESDDTLSMTADYLKWMSTYEENMEKIDEWKSEDMTDEELEYFLDVTNRVNKRLVEVAGSY